MADPFNLQRFVDAQAPIYARVCEELAAGEKRSHWIWYIFPQRRELGRSNVAIKFGIASREEAMAYLAHPLLAPRLVACTRLMLAIEGKPLAAILPFPDDLKFISSMTLFAAVADDPVPFVPALKKYAGGVRDAATVELLEKR